MKFSEEQLVKIGQVIIDYVSIKKGDILLYESTAFDMGSETILEITFNFELTINYNMESKSFVYITDDEVIDETERFHKYLRKSKIKTILELEI